ncbi:regulator of G-protein signaling protein-like protein [Willisornis vidua]|uniref:Regulator of G-protein signaling protein-like protein n=1 Tax=Willisornis vidua TaxID=1566151 RepID=A0ABQ9D9U5_9PASS|nr:regulator of G-protein signaling protein-like protein [Willisornis vidua]
MTLWNTLLEHTRMKTTAAIASTEIGLLLKDDVFVDFFNTFLNLPLILSWGTGLATQDPSPTALLAWLEKHRLPHFCKSSLCLHLVLCQKLLGFIRSGEAAELLNWQSADQWLLEKCISGSQGMLHFQAFVQGTAGEELIDFWLTTERLLDVDESDTSQRDLHLSLIHRLKATHLREGSSVVTLCTTIAGSLPKAKHIQSLSNRRDILRKMQEQALFMLQSYWLPKFFTHCKIGIEEEESCQLLLQKYQEHLLQANWQEPSGFSETLPTMHIKRGQGLSGPYCSQKAKAKIWALVKEGRCIQEMKMPSFHMKPERQPGSAGSTRESHLEKDALGSVPQQSERPANTAFGSKGVTSPRRPRPSAEQVIHLADLCKEKILSNLPSSAPLVQLPSLKEPVKTLSFLHWALSAETCAGRPFRDFLKHQDRSMETHLLDLWHDLEEFLPMVLDSRRENSFFLRHLTGDKICKTYLEEDSTEKLPLETRTLTGLWNHLMFGEFSPWIFRAQKEICKVLCCFYEEFLADDDRTFLQFMRINQTLTLSQALHGTRNLEGVSSEYWQLLAARDLQKGGSTQAEMELLLCSTDFQKMMSDELAMDSPSKDDELVHLLNALLDMPVSSKQSRSPASTSRKGKARPEKLVLVKRRILDKQVIVMNFLIDDLHFYLEMDKFSGMADAVEALAACNIQSEKQVDFLQRKLAVINDLFLNSNMPPKLRVNISEKERDVICRLSSRGPLTRAIFHNAKVTIVHILMYFWRRSFSPSRLDKEFLYYIKGLMAKGNPAARHTIFWLLSFQKTEKRESMSF